MGTEEFSILVSAAFLTSIVSGILGMAGGIMLLSVMLLFFEPLVAIPLHGVVQLVSNSSRTVVQRRHVRWELVGPYLLPLIPMSLLGLYVAREIPPSAAKMLIGIFVLVATWLPGWLRLGVAAQALPRRRFFGLGAMVGFLQMTVGATGPLQAPFFLNLGLERQAVVGTKAACQSAGHLSKIAIFGFAGFAFYEFWPLLGLMCLGVVGGTWIGSQILNRVNERVFLILYRGVLTLVALRLIVLELI